MATTPSLQIGRIVWANVIDPNGFLKLRPAVVVNAANASHPDASCQAVAITSRLPDPLGPEYVILPWHAQGHPRTGLNRRCAAVCTWVCTIRAADVEAIAGVVPGECQLDILTRIKQQQNSNPPPTG